MPQQYFISVLLTFLFLPITRKFARYHTCRTPCIIFNTFARDTLTPQGCYTTINLIICTPKVAQGWHDLNGRTDRSGRWMTDVQGRLPPPVGLVNGCCWQSSGFRKWLIAPLFVHDWFWGYVAIATIVNTMSNFFTNRNDT